MSDRPKSCAATGDLQLVGTYVSFVHANIYSLSPAPFVPPRSFLSFSRASTATPVPAVSPPHEEAQIRAAQIVSCNTPAFPLEGVLVADPQKTSHIFRGERTSDGHLLNLERVWPNSARLEMEFKSSV